MVIFFYCEFVFTAEFRKNHFKHVQMMADDAYITADAMTWCSFQAVNMGIIRDKLFTLYGQCK